MSITTPLKQLSPAPFFCILACLAAPAHADQLVGDSTTESLSNTTVVNVSGNLILGNQTTGNGTYTNTGNTAQTNINFVSGGNGSNPNGALIVGNAGTGSFTQGLADQSDTLNQVTVAGDLALGLQFGGIGTYTINTGTLQVDGAMLVGVGSTNANVFTQNGGTVNLTSAASGNSDYAPVSPGANPPTNPGSLYVGGESVTDNGTGTYVLNGGTLSVSSITLGFSGTGSFNQNGGQVSSGNIDLGACGGCNGGNAAGFYTLTGNGTLTAYGISVGDFGHGEILQNGAGTLNTVNGTLSIGNGATATPNSANPGNYDRSGTYTLDSGTLNTQYTVVGSQGTGTFIQVSGTHAVSNTLTIGQQNSQPLSGPAGSGTDSNPVFGGPAPGVYTMTGGILTAGGDPSIGVSTSNAGIIVGDAGNGTLNQIGGSVTSGVGGGQRGDLLIGAQAGSTGNYNLGDSSNSAPSLQVYGDTTIGRDAAGSVTVPDPNNNLVTVPLASANGMLTIAGDGTTVNVNQTAGFDSHNGGNMLLGLGGVGAVMQTDASTVYMDHNLVLGANAGSNGTYTLNATSLGGSPANLTVGSDLNIGGMTSLTDTYGLNFQTTPTGGTGTFNLQSGDVAAVGAVNVGNNDGTGNMNISGGTLAAGNDMNVGVNDGNVGGSGGGTGTVTQTGGAVTIGDGSNTVSMNLGITANSVDSTAGTYSITGDSSSLTVYGNADLGVSQGGTGSLSIGKGTDAPTVDIFTTGNGDGSLTIGDAGTGKLTVQSGTLNTDGDLSIGVTGGTGTINQSGGTVTIAGVAYVGTGGTGTVTQNGGTFEAGYLDIGIGSTTGNTYTLNNGQVIVDNDVVIGNYSGSGGTFTQTGGTVNVNSSGYGVYINNGTYDLRNGTFTVANNVTVGDVAGGAHFTQEGGTANIGNSLIIGNSGGTSGSVNLNHGAFNVAGSVTVQAVPGSTGTLNVAGGALSAGSVTNNGTLNYSGGSLVLAGGAGTLTNNASGQVNLSGPGTRVVNGNLSNAGTVNLGSTGGVFGTPGLFTANGDFAQGASGTLQELIAGTGAGQYSALSIGGSVNLDGTLNLVTGSGFNFANGQTYDFMSFAPGSLTGQFARIDYGSFLGNSGGVDIGAGLFIKALYNNSLGDIQLQVMTSPVPLPAAWSLLATGLGLMGCVPKRGKQSALAGQGA